MPFFFEGGSEQLHIDLAHYTLNRLFDSQTVGRLHKALVQSEQVGRPSAIIVQSCFGIKDNLQCVCHRRKTNIFFEFFLHAPRHTSDQYLIENKMSFEVFLIGLISRAKVLQHNQSKANEIGDLGCLFVESIQKLTGFDRVALYRIHSDWSGQVIAEAVSSCAVEPFIGLHIHEKGIPSQMRAFYQVIPFRYVADIKSALAPIVCAQQHQAQKVDSKNGYSDHLDITFCHLSCESADYLQFLQSFNIRSAASFAVVVNGQLWGVIDCHHFSVDPLMFESLVRADVVVQQLASAVESRIHGDMVRMGRQVLSVQRRLAVGMGCNLSVYDVVQRSGDDFLSLCGASGFVLCAKKSIVQVGITPSAPFLEQFLPWLETRMSDGLWCSDRLHEEFTSSEMDVDTAAGVLAIGQYFACQGRDAIKLIWFRPAVIRHVCWLRSPHLDLSLSEGQVETSVLKQIESQVSVGWQDNEISAARALYDALSHIMISQLFDLKHHN
jgi:light-regulated signal transduction histidine kinase (bacteriophytochrome)